MSDFKMKPWPCINPANFSKFTPRREYSERHEKVPVHRSVEGENNGECYKIRPSKTPFVLKHLEKTYQAKLLKPEDRSDEEPEQDTQQPCSSGKKRANSEAPTDEELEDSDQPSTSSAVPTKKARRSQ